MTVHHVNVKAVDQWLNPRYVVGEMGKISRKQGRVDTSRHQFSLPAGPYQTDEHTVGPG